MDDWNKRPDGRLEINPVIGWETATAPGTALVRLVYAGSLEEEKAGGKQVQLAMSEIQMESLIRDLNTTLDAVRQHRQNSGG